MIVVNDGKFTIEILSMSERVSMDIMRLLIAKGIDLDKNSDLKFEETKNKDQLKENDDG
jgi:hypothetical protein